jgi:hypothetical protein
MPEEVLLAHAVVCALDDDGMAHLNCQTADGKQMLFRLSRQTLVMLCSSASQELRRIDKRVGRKGPMT